MPPQVLEETQIEVTLLKQRVRDLEEASRVTATTLQRLIDIVNSLKKEAYDHDVLDYDKET